MRRTESIMSLPAMGIWVLGTLNGVVTLTTGTYGNVFRFLPPLTMPVHLLEEALTILEQGFEDATR